MEYLNNGSTETSQQVDNDVMSLYRSFGHFQDALQWLEKQRQQLVRVQLDKESSLEWEDWLMQLYATMRLHYLMKAPEKEALFQPQYYLRYSQGPEADVVDLLAKKNAWDRLCEIGGGTHEMFLRRLQAMASLGVTFETSSEEYVTRFCTDYRKFSEPEQDLMPSANLYAVLLSARKALYSTTFTVEDATFSEQVKKRHAQKRSRRVIVVLIAAALLLGGAVWLLRSTRS